MRVIAPIQDVGDMDFLPVLVNVQGPVNASQLFRDMAKAEVIWHKSDSDRVMTAVAIVDGQDRAQIRVIPARKGLRITFRGIAQPGGRAVS